MFRIAILIFVFGISTALAEEERDGPFGIYMGMPIESLSLETSALYDPDNPSPFWTRATGWGLSSVPKPHPFFGSYFADAVKGIGVCAVTASAISKTDIVFHVQFTDAMTQLAAKYAAPEYAYNSVMNEDPNVTASAVWVARSGAAINEVQRIDLQVLVMQAGDVELAVMSLRFQFSNYRECQIEDPTNPF